MGANPIAVTYTEDFFQVSVVCAPKFVSVVENFLNFSICYQYLSGKMVRLFFISYVHIPNKRSLYFEDFFASFLINDAWINLFQLFLIFLEGVLAVHCKDFASSGRWKEVGHCIELHMFPNQFLQGLSDVIKEKST